MFLLCVLVLWILKLFARLIVLIISLRLYLYFLIILIRLYSHFKSQFVNPLTAMAMLDIAESKKIKTVIVNAAASSLGRMLNRLLPPEGVQIINIVRRE